MSVSPPVPSDAPPNGSVWYCQNQGGWPGWWQQYARWGSLAKVIETVYANGVWKVHFNTSWNPEFGFVNCSDTIPNFYAAFGQQKILVWGATIWGSGNADVHTLQRPVNGNAMMYSGAFNLRLLVKHSLSAEGGAISNRKKAFAQSQF